MRSLPLFLSILPMFAPLAAQAQDVRTATSDDGIRRVLSIRFSPDGRLIAGAVCGKERVKDGYVETGRVQLWDAATVKPVRALATPDAQKLAGTGNWARAIAFGPDGKTVVIGRDDHTIQVRDRETDAEVEAWKGPAAVDSLASSSDGKMLACAYRGTSEGGADLILRDLGTKVPRWYLVFPRSSITAIAFSPDGSRLAAARLEHAHARGGPGTVAILDARTGREKQTLRTVRDGARALAFSPDGETLAGACQDGSVLTWDVRSGTLKRTLEGRAPGRVVAVAFSPDGATIAGASLCDRLQTQRAGNLRLWDAHTGALRRELTTDIDPASSAAFSPDLTRLAIGRDDGTVTGIRFAESPVR